MNPHDNAKSGRAVNLLLAGVCGLGLLALQACATFSMPEPKYPIYMQGRPAAPASAPEASVEQAPAETTPPISAPENHGAIATSDLPPPPPPPPPADTRPADSRPVVPATPAKTASAPATAPVRDTGATYLYILQAHDTLYGVSRRFGVPIKTIYDINALTADSAMRIGQHVLLPASAVDKGVEEHANGTGMTRLNNAPAKPEVKTEVAKTETVKTPPAQTTKTPPVKTVTTTQTVTETAATTTKPQVAPPTKTTTTTTTTVAAAQPSKPVVSPPSAKNDDDQPAPSKPVAPPANGAFPSNTQLSQMGRGMFVWPVKGKIIVPFGQLAPNVRNDGINISAGAGTNVLAAADGVVVYEGDQVKELGNTIYVKHAGGWYTGYSHLSNMSVKNNEKVTKGEVIGSVGQTGVIDRPQLHFEIRYTPSTDIAKPVDPNLVLP